jgi:predicted enzyme related to lactoylglutathione lyase
MTLRAKYVHTNIVALDWKRLAGFYEQVFECKPVPPVRDLSGAWIEAATGINGAHLWGVHLRLPGYDENGPTLEIFQYNVEKEKPATAINRPGFAHLAFAVNEVAEALQRVISAGGRAVGEVVTTDIPNAGRVSFVYATDPEGNIIELQHWEKI